MSDLQLPQEQIGNAVPLGLGSNNWARDPQPIKSVSIVPLLLAVVAGHGDEQRATHESRLPFPPAVAHSLNEAIQGNTSQSVLFLDSSRRSARTAHFPSGRPHPQPCPTSRRAWPLQTGHKDSSIFVKGRGRCAVEKKTPFHTPGLEGKK